MAARYGGEEFTIILPATNLENAKDIAEQMRTAILNAAIPHRYSDTENIVTASFGVAMVIPQKDQYSHNLVSRADKALYMAKKDGRNRVVAFSPQLISETEENDNVRAG